MNTQELAKEISNTLGDYVNGRDVHGVKIPDEYFINIRQHISEFEQNRQGLANKNRNIRLGIVGEVKAGKSSFLNALIFKGKDVLPKATTPMTAALTVIRYGTHESAKIVYYSPEDWSVIETKAKLYDEQWKSFQKELKQDKRSNNDIGYDVINDLDEAKQKNLFEQELDITVKSCKELLTMFSKNQKELNKLLGTEQHIDIYNLQEDLKDFVGADGRYTPIVKHVELTVNLDELKGIEIVDTPGMNDPIASRGQKTRDFLKQCDIVFLLSYTGQFMTAEDISYMRHTLPTEGVKNVIIVGSKFDSGILDDNRSTSWMQAVKQSMDIYNKQADSTLGAIIQSSDIDDRTINVLKKIQSTLPASYISSLLYMSALKQESNLPLSEEEAFILRRLSERFADFNANDTRTIKGISGIPNIKKDRINPILMHRDQLIKDKQQELVVTVKHKIYAELNEIESYIVKQSKNLKSSNLQELDLQLATAYQIVSTMEEKITNIFEEHALEATTKLNALDAELIKEQLNWTDVRVHKKEYKWQEEKWWGLRTVDKYKKVDFVELKDASDNIDAYYAYSKEMIDERFKNAVDIDLLKGQLEEKIKSIVNDIDTVHIDYDYILQPMKNNVKKIIIPELKTDPSLYSNHLIEKFGDSVVEENDIHTLHTILKQELSSMQKSFKNEIKDYIQCINEQLNEVGLTLVGKISNNISSNINILKEQLADKEQALQEYDKVLYIVQQLSQKVDAWGEEEHHVI